MLSKNPCHLYDCIMDLKNKLPDGGATGSYSVEPKEGSAGCSSGSLKAPFLLLTLRGHCEDEMKKYLFIVTKAK